MTSASNLPKKDDAVLGGQGVAPPGSLVLGGLAGIERRLTSDRVDQRIAALWELQKWNLQKSSGSELLIQALQDSSVRVQKVAYWLLRSSSDRQAIAALQHYSFYRLFECLHVLTGHEAGVTAIALSTRHFRYRDDQEMLVSASRNGVIKGWDLHTREELFTLNAGTIVYALSLDADQDLLIAKCKNQLVKAWSLRTEQKIKPPEKQIKSIASVTVDGKHLISSSQSIIKVWDLQQGREVCLLQGHSSLVTAVAVNQDRSLLISGSEDQTIRIWGIEF
ncbi:WD40 repeat domain-containing protein [Phormidesmis priestleyi]